MTSNSLSAQLKKITTGTLSSPNAEPQIESLLSDLQINEVSIPHRSRKHKPMLITYQYKKHQVPQLVPSTILTVLSSSASTQKPLIPNDMIILVTADGTEFITSRPLLAAHSSVFSTASRVSVFLSSNSFIEKTSTLLIDKIDLSTTSDGLNLILAVISILGHNHDISELSSAILSYIPRITSTDIRMIAEALDCAHAYDFAPFRKHFIWQILNSITSLDTYPSPIIAFTLIAVVDRRACDIRMVFRSAAADVLRSLHHFR